jgi:ATP-dependent exoDNAse (exonuclease V) alpha subunit
MTNSPVLTDEQERIKDYILGLFDDNDDIESLKPKRPYDDDSRSVVKSIISERRTYIRYLIGLGNCDDLTKKELWIELNNYSNIYNPDLTYSYAITVHKSQGSSYNNVFVDISDLSIAKSSKNPTKFYDRMLYTAISRFRKNIRFMTIPYDSFKKAEE